MKVTMLRQFEIGDRVKCWISECWPQGRWVTGTVVAIGPRLITRRRRWFDALYIVRDGRVYDKHTEEESSSIIILAMDDEKVTCVDSESQSRVKYVLTDERVDDDPGPDTIFGGFGLMSRLEEHLYTIFEDEVAPLRPQVVVEAGPDDDDDMPF